MKKLFVLIPALFLVWLALSPAQAEGSDCSDWRTSDAFSYSSLQSPKAFFYDDYASGKALKSFVVKGDVVAVRNVKFDFACVVYINKKGLATIGWLELKALKDTKVPGSAVGKWKLLKNGTSLGIEIQSNKLTGVANLNASNESWISGSLSKSGNLWAVQDGNCTLAGLFLNGFLMVRTSDHCSHLKINFSGVFGRT